MRRLVLIFHCLLFLSDVATAVSNVNWLLRKNSRAATETPIVVPAYNISLPIDHFNKTDVRTFDNRYWINDSYYEPGGPVFFYDFGESGVEPDSVASTLAESDGPHAVMRLAQRYRGLAIGWEHRYYGESQPFPATIINALYGVNGTHETWRYLTLEQSLEDVAYFSSHFSPDGYSSQQTAALAPSKVPWIWVGGSYAGSRAVWMRIRNPEIFYAAWSSSAPIQTHYDGSTYFDPIENSLPANCSADIKSIIKYVDGILDRKYGDTAFTQLQQLVYAVDITIGGFNVSLNFTNAAQYDEASIASALLDPIYTTFQYDGPSRVTHPFCDYLESYNTRALNATAGSTAATIQSILQNPGDGQISDQGIVRSWGLSFGVQAYVYAARRLRSTRTNYEQNMIDDNVWSYQYLTEFGWIQGSLPQDITIVSRFYNYTYVRANTASNSFSAKVAIPSEPNVNLALDRYGGWNMAPSNVMFTNGEYDPWRAFSVMSQEYEKGAPVRKVVQTVPRCNVSPRGLDVFGLLYTGAVHVEDFSGEWNQSSNDPAAQGFALFSKALDAWLPCFRQR